MLCVYSQGRNHTHNTRHHVRNAAHARSSDPQRKRNQWSRIGRSVGKHDGMRSPSRQRLIHHVGHLVPAGQQMLGCWEPEPRGTPSAVHP